MAEVQSVRRRRPESVPAESSHPTANERQELFNNIAPVYDKLNDVFSFGLHRRWKRWTVYWSGVKDGDTVLDLCCGSGDLSFLLSEKVGINGKVIGLDFSTELLKISSSRQHEWSKSKPCYNNITWVQGVAVDLPFSDSYFDAATIGFGLRNIVDREKAMKEILRVLKPGSKVSSLDFNKSGSSFTSKLQEWMIEYIVTPVAWLFGLAKEYHYLKNSIKGFFTGNELEQLTLEAGFSKVEYIEAGRNFGGHTIGTLLHQVYSFNSILKGLYFFFQ